jgi:hypothetical protein
MPSEAAPRKRLPVAKKIAFSWQVYLLNPKATIENALPFFYQAALSLNFFKRGYFFAL